MLIWSSYIGGEISRCLFKTTILAEIYYKGWRDLEGAFIIGGEI